MYELNQFAVVSYSGGPGSLPSHHCCCALEDNSSAVVLVEPYSGLGPCNSNICYFSEIFLSQEILLSLTEILRRCHLFFLDIPKVKTWCECRAAGGEAPAVCSLCLLESVCRVVNKWQLIMTTNLARLFVSPCLSFYTSIRPFWLWHQLSAVQVCMFSVF